MRLWGLRLPTRAALAVGSIATALVLPAQALAEQGHHPKVDDAVAAVLDAPRTPSSDKLHVIVYGSDAAAAIAAVGGSVKQSLDLIGAHSALVSANDVDKVAEHAGVSYIVLDAPVRPTGKSPTNPVPTTDPAASLATQYPRIDGAVAAWNQGLTGKDMGIVVIDSGAVPIAEFGGGNAQSRLTQSLLGWQTGNVNDSYGHGTFVTAVAAGNSSDGAYKGIAPDAKIYAINVQSSYGIRTSDVIAGLMWVLRKAETSKNIKVVNLSLSETRPSSYLRSPLDTAVEMVWRKGIVVVASAGNLGPNSALYAPGNDPFAITVGAFDTRGTLDTSDDVLAPWSSYGITRDGFTKPELLAPGRQIVSRVADGSTLLGQAPASNVLGSGYVRMSGTSFAAPQVAGAVALLRQKNPRWTPDQVKWVLMQYSRPLPDGSGVALDLARALEFTGTPESANQGIPPAMYGTVGWTTQDFRNAAQWEKAAAWDASAAAWDRKAQMYADKAAAWDAAAAWDKSAAAWDRAGAAWARAAAAWDLAAAWDRAAAAWDKSAAAWDKGAAAWDLAGNATYADASQTRAGEAWLLAAAWDRSAAAWDGGAGWSAAAWDVHGASDVQSVWDRAAAWDTSGLWE